MSLSHTYSVPTSKMTQVFSMYVVTPITKITAVLSLQHACSACCMDLHSVQKVVKNTPTMLICDVQFILIAGVLYYSSHREGRVHCASSTRLSTQWLFKPDRNWPLSLSAACSFDRI